MAHSTAPPCAVLLALLALPGCGSGLSGTYADAGSPTSSLEFKSGGRVYVTTFGGTFVGSYEVDGDHVIVKGPHGSQVFQRSGAELSDGAGATYVKKE
jgi:hypothetical protein